MFVFSCKVSALSEAAETLQFYDIYETRIPDYFVLTHNLERMYVYAYV